MTTINAEVGFHTCCSSEPSGRVASNSIEDDNSTWTYVSAREGKTSSSWSYFNVCRLSEKVSSWDDQDLITTQMMPSLKPVPLVRSRTCRSHQPGPRRTILHKRRREPSMPFSLIIEEHMDILRKEALSPRALKAKAHLAFQEEIDQLDESDLIDETPVPHPFKSEPHLVKIAISQIDLANAIRAKNAAGDDASNTAVDATAKKYVDDIKHYVSFLKGSADVVRSPVADACDGLKHILDSTGSINELFADADSGHTTKTQSLEAIGNYFSGGRVTRLKTFFDSVEGLAVNVPDMSRVTRAIVGCFNIVESSIAWAKNNKLILFVMSMLVMAQVKCIVDLAAGLLKKVISSLMGLVSYLPTLLREFVTFLSDRMATSTYSAVPKKEDPSAEEDFETRTQAGPDGASSLIAMALMAFLSKTDAKSVATAIKHGTILAAGVASSGAALAFISEHFPTRLKEFLIECKVIEPMRALDRKFQTLVRESHRLTMRVDAEPEAFNEPGFAAAFLAHYDMLLYKWPEALICCRANSPERVFVSHVLKKMEKHRDAARLRATASRRVCPVGVFISGPKGIGKTVAANTLAAVALPRIAATARTWWWNPSSDYWTGFTGQGVIGFDDFGVSADTEAHIETILRLISDNEFLPNMAFNKGISARPVAFLATANFKLREASNGGKSWTNPKTQSAFNRRFLNFEATLNSEYAGKNGRLDPTKLPKDPNELAKYPHLNFAQWEVTHTSKTKKTDVWELTNASMTLMDVARLVRAHILKKETERETMIKTDVATAKLVCDELNIEPIVPDYEVLDDSSNSIVNSLLNPLIPQIPKEENKEADEAKVRVQMNTPDDDGDDTPDDLPDLIGGDDEEEKYPSAESDDEFFDPDPIIDKDDPLGDVSIPPIVVSEVSTPPEDNWDKLGFGEYCFPDLDDPTRIPAYKKRSDINFASMIDPSRLSQRDARIYIALRESNLPAYSRARAASSWAKAMIIHRSPETRELAKQNGCTTADMVGKNLHLLVRHVKHLGSFFTFDARRPTDVTNPTEDVMSDWINPLSWEQVCLLTMHDPLEVYHRMMETPVAIVNGLRSDGRTEDLMVLPQDPVINPDSESPEGFFKTNLDKIRSMLSTVPWAKLGTGLAALSGLGMLIAMSVNSSRAPEEFDSTPQAPYKKAKRRPIPKASRYDSHTQMYLAGIELEDSGSEAKLNAGRAIAKIGKSVVTIERLVNGNPHGNMNAFIQGGYLITNKHFFVVSGTDDLIPDTTNIRLKATGSDPIDFLFDHTKLSLMSNEVCPDGYNRDLCRYALPRKVQSVPDITKFFPSRGRTECFKECDAYYLVSGTDYIPCARAELSNWKATWTTPGGETKYGLARYMSYDPMVDGSCGSLLIGVRNNTPIILSLHVAQRTSNRTRISESVGDIIYKEDFDFLKDDSVTRPQIRITADPTVPPSDHISYDVSGEPRVELAPVYTYEGRLSVKPRNGSTKTKFRRSPLFDDFPSGKSPALLGAKDDPRCEGLTTVDLIKKEMNLAVGKELNVPQADLDDAADLYFKQVAAVTEQDSARVLSFPEAINGIDGSTLGPVSLTTSACYPLNTLATKPGKRDFLVKGEDDKLHMEPILEDEVHRAFTALKDGKDPMFIFQTALKDETRSATKIEQKRTRVVQGGPLAHTIIMRKMFGSLMDALQSKFRELPSAVGMDVYSEDWHDMIRRMAKVGAKGFDGDIKKFECYFRQNVRQSFNKFAREFYDEFDPNCTEDDHLIREALVYHTTHAHLGVGGSLYTADCLNPSGTAGTTILFNGFLVHCMVFCAYKIVARVKAPDFANSIAFTKNIAYKTFGDDHIAAVSEIAEWFNYHSCAGAMESMGVTYTPADKNDANPLSLKPLKDLQFLANVSVVRDNTYIAVPNEEDARKHLAYVTTTLPVREALEAKIIDVQRMLYGYGSEEFDKFSAEVRRSLRDAGIDIKLPSYADTAESYRLKKVRRSLNRPAVEESYDPVTPPHSVEEFYPKYNRVFSDKMDEYLRLSTIAMWFGTVSEDGMYFPDTMAPVLPSPGYAPPIPSCGLCLSLGHNQRLPCPVHTPEPEYTTRTQMQSSVGVTLDNADQGSFQKPAANLPASDAVAELQLDYVTTLQRRQQLYSLTWDTTQIFGSSLVQSEFPRAGVKGNIFKSLFRMFVMQKCKVKFTAQMQSNPYQQGQLMMGWIPLTTPAVAGANILSNRQALLQCPHVMITAGATRSAELEVEFVHSKKFLDFSDSGDILGTFYIMPWNSLQVGPLVTGEAASARITVFVSYPGAEFKVLDPSDYDAIALNNMQAQLNEANSRLSKLRIADELKEAEEYSTRIQGNISYTNINSKGAVDYSSSAESAVDAKGSLDKPNFGGEVPRIVSNGMSDLSSITNSNTTAYVLDADPGRTSLAKEGDFGTSEDETSLAALCARKSYLDIFQWSSTFADGDVLYKGELIPNPLMLDTVQGSTCQPTLLGYLMQMFQFWKMDLVLTIQIVGSKFHTGRIAICSHYGRTSDPLVELRDAMGQYAAVLDMTESNTTIKVVFPYRAPTEMLKTATWAIPPAATENDNWRRFSMGEFSIRVLNSLRAPEGVSQAVDVNLFWSAENVTVDFLRQIPSTVAVVNGFTGTTVTNAYTEPFDPLPGEFTTKTQMETDATAPTNLISDDAPINIQEASPDEAVLAPASGSTSAIPARDTSFTNVMDACKRSSVMRNTMPEIELQIQISELFLGSGPTSQYPSGGPIRWLAPLYRLWKGSFVFTVSTPVGIKVAFSPDSQLSSVDLMKSGFGQIGAGDNIVGMGPVTTKTQYSGLSVFKIPFQSQYHVLQVPRADGDAKQPMASSGQVVVLPMVEDPDGIILAAAGDDFRFGQLYFVPQLKHVAVP